MELASNISDAALKHHKSQLAIFGFQNQTEHLFIFQNIIVELPPSEIKYHDSNFDFFIVQEYFTLLRDQDEYMKVTSWRKYFCLDFVGNKTISRQTKFKNI